MNYQRIHDRLIKRAKNRVLNNSYIEEHHVIPRCLGGTDEQLNLVRLTAKEHFIIHRLLCVIYPGNKSLRFAFWMMCSMDRYNKRYKVSSKTYQGAKEVIHSKKSEDHKRKISNSLMGHRGANIGKKMPIGFGESISRAKKGMIGTNKGIPMKEEQKVKISNKLKGHIVSEITRKKISDTLLKRRLI